MYEPKNAKDLADFLKSNKEKFNEIWIVLVKKEFANPQPVSFSGLVSMAVEQGLIDSKTKKIIGTPQITSRGFIFVKENFDLVNATKRVVEKVVKEKTSEGLPVNWDYVKNNIREAVGSFLFTKTERRPMVLPVVIEV